MHDGQADVKGLGYSWFPEGFKIRGSRMFGRFKCIEAENIGDDRVMYEVEENDFLGVN